MKGPQAGQLFRPEPWQSFIITTFFGWVRIDNGQRRFRTAYDEMPRGQGKSFLSSGIALYAETADGEGGAEVYAAATTTDQARIVFESAQVMLRHEKAAALCNRLGIEVGQHAIVQERSNSTFKPISSEAKNHEGKNIHCAVVDELHVHPTSAVLDVLKTGLAKRLQSFMWIITTAGSSIEGPCYQQRDYVISILSGKVQDDTYFGIIYTIDPEDLPRAFTDEKVWQKANPNWGISVQPDMIRSLAREAINNPSAQAAFLTRHLCVWVAAAAPFFDMEAWNRCADAPPQSEFLGESCWMGLDLASKSDIASRADVFVRDLPDGRHYYLYTHHYLNEEAVQSSKNAPSYKRWMDSAELVITPGNITDFGTIQADIEQDANSFRIESVGFDPWQGQQMAQQLQAKGLTTIEVKPNVANFSHVMKELLALSKTGHLHHDGNSVMGWCVANVEAVEDRNGNVFPRKAGDMPHKKIDGVVATLTALNRALLQEASGPIFFGFKD